MYLQNWNLEWNAPMFRYLVCIYQVHQNVVYQGFLLVLRLHLILIKPLHVIFIKVLRTIIPKVLSLLHRLKNWLSYLYERKYPYYQDLAYQVNKK